MKRKGWYVFWMLICFVAVAPGLFSQVTFLPGDPVVEELKELYHSSGKVLPTTAYPFTREDLRFLADKLGEWHLKKMADIGDADSPKLTEHRARLEAVDAFIESLDFSTDEHRIGVKPAVNFETYLRTKEEWPDFSRLWLQSRPILDLYMWYSLDPKALFVIEAPLRREYKGFSVTNLPASEPGNPFGIEGHFVYKGLFWYNFDPLRVSLGRHPVHYGPLKSSLLPSDRLPFLDMLRVQLPLGPITMDLLLSTLENRQTVNDVDLTGTDFAFRNNLIFLAIHRFEIDFSFLRLGVSGREIYIREENGFLLGDFFPVFSWHQSDLVPNNLCMIVDLDLILFKELHLMAMYGLDDFASTSVGITDEGIPTIDAWILGAEYATDLFGGRFAAYAETGYTHYLWENYNDELALGRAIYRLAIDTGYQPLPLTSPFGPGTFWVYTDASLEDVYGFDFLISFQYLSKNTLANTATTPYAESAVVANAPHDSILSFGAKVEFSGLPVVSVFAEPSLHIKNGDPWLEFVLGATATYAFKGKL